MKFTETPLFGSYLIDLEPSADDRGFFARFYCEKEFHSFLRDRIYNAQLYLCDAIAHKIKFFCRCPTHIYYPTT